MSKINDYSTVMVPQEVSDMLDDIKQNINFGKQQLPVVNSYPTWNGRLGEMCVLTHSTTWALLTCTSDQTNRWATMSNFYP